MSLWPAVEVSAFGISDVGECRLQNEDAFLIADLTRQVTAEQLSGTAGPAGWLFVVCDGCCETENLSASRIAVDTIYQQLPGLPGELSIADRAAIFEQVFIEANQRIYRAATSTKQATGTTATAVWAWANQLLIGQIGDSRAYLLRQGELCQITKDQTLVQQKLDAGLLTPEEAEQFEMKSVILQALGVSESMYPDFTACTICQNDILLVCSDGLYNELPKAEIREILCHSATAKQACTTLIKRANQADGGDNCSAIVARFSGPGLESVPTAVSEAKAAPVSFPRATTTSPRTSPRTAKRGTPDPIPPSGKPSRDLWLLSIIGVFLAAVFAIVYLLWLVLRSA